MPQQRPNILFVFADQHRPDWVGYDGDVPVRTPNLDALVEDGVAFRNAITPAPVCGPARSSLASGLEYDQAYVRDHHAGQDYPLGAPTLYGRLRDQGGYHTIGTGKWDLQKYSGDAGADGKRFLEQNGFSDGFEAESGLFNPVGEPKGPYQHYIIEEGLEDTFEEEFPRGVENTEILPIPEEAYQDNWIGRNSEAVIRDAPSEQPWFAQINFVKPHNPWDVTEAMDEWYHDPDVEFPDPLDPGAAFDTEHHQEIRRNYSAMVQNVDRRLGRLLDLLEERGERENTIVIYASDHGESLGDRGSWKKRTPYRECCGVPFVVSGPQVETRGVVDAPATILDIHATALDWADVPVPEIQSQTMRPYLEGSTDEEPRDVVFSGLGPWRMAFDGRYKYVRGFDPEQPHNGQVWEFDSYDEFAVQQKMDEHELLFDLEADQTERESVLDQNPDVIARLDAQLQTLRS